jgi:hypothetical protein
MWPDRRIQDLLGIELPIIQAPMAGAGLADLAIGVAEAGGLGSLPCALLRPDQLRTQFGIIRQRTQRPINVNFFCHRPAEFDAAREAAWRRRLEPYYREFGLDPEAPVPASNRAPFDDEFCALVEELRPEVVSFHFGLPERRLLDRVLATDAKILSSATTVEEARWLEAEGCHAIIAQGSEAGGHRGMFRTEDVATQVGTFSLCAAGGGCRGRAGDRGRRHCRWSRHRRRLHARRFGGADRDGLPVLSGVDDCGSTSAGTRNSRRVRNRTHQRLHRTSCPRHRQPCGPRGWAALTSGAGLPLGWGRTRAPPRSDGAERVGRVHVALVGPIGRAMPGNARGRTHPTARRPGAQPAAASLTLSAAAIQMPARMDSRPGSSFGTSVDSCWTPRCREASTSRSAQGPCSVGQSGCSAWTPGAGGFPKKRT